MEFRTDKPRNHLVIERISAVVSVDDDGNEGILGSMNPANGQWMPFIAADPERLSQLVPMAEEISQITGITYRVLQFTGKVDITAEAKEKYLK